MPSRWWVRPSEANRAKSSAYRSRNPLPSFDTGARPASSQGSHSDAGDAPSLCVADGTPARGASNQQATQVGVTGALISELALQGHVDLADGRVRLTGTRPEQPLLAQVLDNLAPHEGKKLKRRLGSVKHAGWTEVV